MPTKHRAFAVDMRLCQKERPGARGAARPAVRQRMAGRAEVKLTEPKEGEKGRYTDGST
jgi:hypothetical protein